VNVRVVDSGGIVDYHFLKLVFRIIIQSQKRRLFGHDPMEVGFTTTCAISAYDQ
jgi:hypothetical protein